MKSIIQSIVTVSLVFCLVTPAEAIIRIQPRLIDETVQARDAITQNITLTNTTDTKRIVYATVNEITLGESGEILEFISPVMSDRTETVTSWIEITRGRIVIEPMAEVQIPLTFRINPQAESGEYYAFIGFVPTSKRPDAEAIALAGDANGIAVTLTVASDDVESFTVSQVESRRVFTDISEEVITVTLNNEGDLPVDPEGEVIFYSARGIEVGASQLNPDGIQLAPGEIKQLTVPVSIPEQLGRYRASVNVTGNSVSILDTTQFFFIPLYLLIIVLILLTILSAVLTMMIKRSLEHPEYDPDGHEVQLYDNTGTKTKNDTDHDITISK